MRSTLAVFAALLLWAAPAFAEAPSAGTGSAKSVSDTAATLTGTVNAHGRPTSYYFQYGTSTSYGSRTANTSAGAGSKAVSVSAPVTGLKALTTYHYRLVTFNPDGSTNGKDRTFKTTQVPVTLSLSVSPNPVLFGAPVTVSGAAGGRPEGQQVVLQQNPWDFTGGFVDVGNPQITNATGQFAFPVLNLTSKTQFRVRTTEKPPAYSDVVTEAVAVNVSVRSRVKHHPHSADVLLTGTVKPAHDAAPFAVQKQKGSKWVTVKGGATKHASSTSSGYSAKLHIRRGGHYRVYVQIPDGANTSGVSLPILIKAKR